MSSSVFLMVPSYSLSDLSRVRVRHVNQVPFETKGGQYIHERAPLANRIILLSIGFDW